MSDETSAAPPVPTFAPHERVCGNCKLWQPHSVEERGWVGPCRLQPSRGLFPPSAPICDVFVARGTAAPPPLVEPAARARRPRSVAPTIVRRTVDGSQPVELDVGGVLNMTRDELMEIFLEASGMAEIPLASKWEGGVIQIIPGNRDLQGKELPVEALFHKVVMVRDRLRVLEQKLNAHPKLTDAEKVEMQQYITRIYGSLTTFNVLFRDKRDNFVGEKGSGD